MDKRLETVAKYVVGNVMCDVGCDHGKLCAELLVTDKVKEAYGIDISEASLEKSKEVKDKLALDNFHLLVGDGFEPVLNHDINCGVICGIGSNETIGIIKRQIDFAKSLERLILCPLKNTFTVREFLLVSGFMFEDEDVVFERGRYYNIFVCKSGNSETFDDVDIYVGRRLLEKKHPLLKEWLENRITAMKENISAYDSGVKTERLEKRENLKRMYNAYVRGLDLCR